MFLHFSALRVSLDVFLNRRCVHRRPQEVQTGSLWHPLAALEADIQHGKIEDLMRQALAVCEFETVVMLVKACDSNNLLFLTIKHQWPTLVDLVIEHLKDPDWWTRRPDGIEFLCSVFKFSDGDTHQKWVTALRNTAGMYQSWEVMPQSDPTKEQLVAIETHIRNTQAAYNELDDDEAFGTFYEINVKPQFTQIVDELVHDVVAFLKVRYDDAIKVCSLSMQVMRGGHRGQSWADKRPETMPILQWFEQSLLRVNTAQLEMHKKKGSDAVTGFRNELQSHDGVFGEGVDFAAQFDVQRLDDARADLTSAFEVSKHEWLFGSALLKPDSTKFTTRLNLYKGTAVAALGETWATNINQALRAEIEKHTGALPSDATAPALALTNATVLASN